MKHADSFAVKLPIAFPYILTRIVLNQHPEVFHPQDTLKKVWPLTLDKKLFVGIHVPNIMVKYQGQSASENSSPISKATIKYVLLGLIEVSKYLQETIISSTIRKRNFDGLIIMFSKKKEA